MNWKPMNYRYETEVNREAWRHVLEKSRTANVFHDPDYFDILEKEGNRILFACAYADDQPVGVIAGTLYRSGYHAGLVEIGTKSGGYPVMTGDADQRPDADEIQNEFLRFYLENHLKDRRFFLYPCFSMGNCLLDDTEWGVVRQVDQTVLLDLTPDADALWAGLNQKCRNVVRVAQRKGVTAEIANNMIYLEQFYGFYRSLRERLNTGYMSYDEIQSRFDTLVPAGKADLWVAFHEERPLAYAFIWKYDRTINFVYGASDPETLSLKPNNLLQWEIIRHYRSRGYRLYNMWGVRNMNFSEEHGTSDQRKIEGYGKFKLSFGAELTDIIRYYRI